MKVLVVVVREVPNYHGGLSEQVESEVITAPSTDALRFGITGYLARSGGHIKSHSVTVLDPHLASDLNTGS